MSMEATANVRVEIIPAFLGLKKRLGGSIAALFTPAKIAAAEAAVEALRPELLKEVKRLIKEIKKEVRDRNSNWAKPVWAKAHELRGLAGTAGVPELGASANLLCHYLTNVDEDFTGDANLVSSITVLALHAVGISDKPQAMMPTLLREAGQAVAVQMGREGRAPDM